MKKPAAYSHAVLVSPGCEVLHMAGQIPLSENDEVPESFDGQARLVFANLKKVLDAAGMTPADIVKMTTFLIRREDGPLFQALRGEFMQGSKPASTLVYVDGLGRPEFLIEIEVTAAR